VAEESKDDLKRLDVQLFIVHPTIDPDDITAALGLEPSHAHRIGDNRKTPKDTPLPGQYPDTRWRHSVRYDVQSQHFHRHVADLLDRLTPHKSFLMELRASGGRGTLIVQFLGDGYFGDTLPLDMLSKLVDLQLDLGLECYTVPQSP
jgi:hypothetical protein